ncbi:S8 family serine peptidase [Microbacterium trichothecenolyticum]|uniref:Gram-positive cocci surface proteins LPxTG domain-containing protein n=1 Tax=Microbacterium trichothecenolyticum TaxID=69370 RepID=A0ABU0TU16_MICTR|nr:S8 family serine peptidase [Microbacterium trichothecenolyticum]MDQ1123148.1 hypothetical protein [Microbacterium trichothecenolyticum]
MRTRVPVTMLATMAVVGVMVWAGVPSAASAAPTSCRTVPVDADPILHSDVARAEFGVDGSGVKVGIISNTFSALSSPANDTVQQNIDDGLLPGPGNPCGYTTPVTIVVDDPPPSPSDDDEGRAMAQMVHGVAPGAELFWASAGPAMMEVGNAINKLQQAGVDVIVDDVIDPVEPLFQDSTVSQQIAAARAAGITYLTAAGNSTALAQRPRPGQDATPIGAWSTAAYRPVPCDLDVTDPDQKSVKDAITDAAQMKDAVAFDCLDFDPGDAADVVSTITTLPGEVATSETQAHLPVTFQWAEAFGGPGETGTAAARFEMFVTFAGQGTQVVATLVEGYPVRYSDLTIDVTGLMNPTDLTADELDMNVTIVRYLDGTPGADITPAVGWIALADGPQWAVSAEYWRSQGPDDVGRSILGHNGAPAAITVAATGVTDDVRIDTYSSLGPVRYFLGPEDDATGTAERLAEPEVIAKPTVLSVDGSRQTATSFGGKAPETAPGVWRFYGTSSATPIAGAVVALALQLDPDLTPDDVESLLTQTAAPFASPYLTIPETDSVGAGLVDAEALLTRVAQELPPIPAGEPAVRLLAATGVDATPTVLGAGVLGLGLLAAGAMAVVSRRRRA